MSLTTQFEEIDQPVPVSRLVASGNNMFSCGPEDEAPQKRREARVKPPMYPVVGEVIDVNGDWWDVRDVRDTKHGFDLCFGSPASDNGVFSSGLPRLIATKPLWDFWDVNRTKNHGFLFDLPAGRTTLKRLRGRLGFNHHDDTWDFWANRIDDLASLRPSEFAAKHEVSRDAVSAWRMRMVGRRARKMGWWRKAKVRKVLLSGLTLIKTGRKLGISISHASRLRDRAKLELQLLSTPVDRKVTLDCDPNQCR